MVGESDELWVDSLGGWWMAGADWLVDCRGDAKGATRFKGKFSAEQLTLKRSTRSFLSPLVVGTILRPKKLKHFRLSHFHQTVVVQ
jgi:hypothetical protein